MNLHKIIGLGLVLCGLFLIITSAMWSKNYPTSDIVKNSIMGIGFLVGGILTLTGYIAKMQSKKK